MAKRVVRHHVKPTRHITLRRQTNLINRVPNRVRSITLTLARYQRLSQRLHRAMVRILTRLTFTSRRQRVPIHHNSSTRISLVHIIKTRQPGLTFLRGPRRLNLRQRQRITSFIRRRNPTVNHVRRPNTITINTNRNTFTMTRRFTLRRIFQRHHTILRSRHLQAAQPTVIGHPHSSFLTNTNFTTRRRHMQTIRSFTSRQVDLTRHHTFTSRTMATSTQRTTNSQHHHANKLPRALRRSRLTRRRQARLPRQVNGALRISIPTTNTRRRPFGNLLLVSRQRTRRQLPQHHLAQRGHNFIRTTTRFTRTRRTILARHRLRRLLAIMVHQRTHQFTQLRRTIRTLNIRSGTHIHNIRRMRLN